MGPRKQKKKAEKAQPAADAKTTDDQPEADNNDSPEMKRSRDDSAAPKDAKDAKKLKSEDNKLSKRSSIRGWDGGTWPRLQKSRASTSVARESILADKPKNDGSSTVDLSRFDSRSADSSASSRPSSVRTSRSKLGLNQSEADPKDNSKTAPAVENGNTDTESTKKPDAPADEAPADTRESEDTASTGPAAGNKEPCEHQRRRSSTWLGWLGKPVLRDIVRDSSGESFASAPQVAEPVEAASEAPPAESKTTDKKSTDKKITDSKTVENKNTDQKPADEQSDPAPGPAATSESVRSVAAGHHRRNTWFGIWPLGSTTTLPEAEETQAIVPEVKPDESKPDDTMPDEPQISHKVTDSGSNSSWAFWSRETKDSKETGEIAVAGDTSQDAPKPATVPEEQQPEPAKRGRSKTLTGYTPTSSPAPSKPLPPNLLLPSFRSTYHLVENPSIIQQLARMLLRSHQPPPRHVHISEERPRIKKAVAIGVHGLFPATYLRTVIGQPTGTSIRFANHAATSIKKWAEKNQPDIDIEVEKVALEGEGKISERVENLWRLLLNWIDHVRNADFILIACHSQGVPVSMMLVAKLIEFGVVNSARIGVCAMAGVSLGPFADYKSKFLTGSAAELFDFAYPDSEVSQKYIASLRAATKFGVRITYCGSIDDQLVSLESSIFSTVNHPYIFRAVFVDGRIHAPDFIAHLVGFALKLRNLGVSDHGLIRELSAPLAGSLYTGEGHSSLYHDLQVYDLAIEFALESTSMGDVPLHVQRYEIPTNPNPYMLPWSIRGLLEEDVVKTELSQESADLLGQFDEWKPSTKVLKDVKFRLEAVRSKL